MLVHMDQIRSLLSRAYMHTEQTAEKTVNVRKAAGKLIKGCLKGLVSYYPTPIPIVTDQPLYMPSNPDTIKVMRLFAALPFPIHQCYQNYFLLVQVTWYTPSPEALEAGAAVLRETVSSSMATLISLVAAASIPLNSAAEGTTDPIKKSEETFISHLVVILEGLEV
jgi:hypothetical protein